jgi:hypothetical protein
MVMVAVRVLDEVPEDNLMDVNGEYKAKIGSINSRLRNEAILFIEEEVSKRSKSE